MKFCKDCVFHAREVGQPDFCTRDARRGPNPVTGEFTVSGEVYFCGPERAEKRPLSYMFATHARCGPGAQWLERKAPETGPPENTPSSRGQPPLILPGGVYK